MKKLSIFKTIFNKKKSKLNKSALPIHQVINWINDGMTDKEWSHATQSKKCEYDYLAEQLEKIKPLITDDEYDNAKLKLYTRHCSKRDE
jgi:hypothetical protein